MSRLSVTQQQLYVFLFPTGNCPIIQVDPRRNGQVRKCEDVKSQDVHDVARTINKH